jgi:hypothetical protein
MRAVPSFSPPLCPAATTLPYRHHSPRRDTTRSIGLGPCLSRRCSRLKAIQWPPHSPHNAPISPQLIPSLRAPSRVPARGSGLALPGFGRATTNDSEARSSYASTAITRRQYCAAYIERVILDRQCLAHTRSTPRPQGVPLPTQDVSPLHAPLLTLAWDAWQCLACSGGARWVRSMENTQKILHVNHYLAKIISTRW